jgi:hypothetical protein
MDGTSFSDDRGAGDGFMLSMFLATARTSSGLTPPPPAASQAAVRQQDSRPRPHGRQEDWEDSPARLAAAARLWIGKPRQLSVITASMTERTHHVVLKQAHGRAVAHSDHS